MNSGARWSYATVGLFLATLLGGLSLLYYFWFFEAPDLSYPKEALPFQLVEDSRTYYEGDVVPLQVVRCSARSDNFGYRVSHAFENLSTGELFILPDETQVPIKPGCWPGVSLINRLPVGVSRKQSMPPGLYRVVGAGIVAGTMKEHRVEWTSEPFTFGGVRPREAP